jgi:outer membrane autotransporter protein
MQLRDGALGGAAAKVADSSGGRAADVASQTGKYPWTNGSKGEDLGAPINGVTPDEEGRAWLRGYGFYEEVDGSDCFGCGYDASIGAAMVGADWAIDGGGIVGAFAGIGPGSINYDAIYGNQSENITQAFAGIYGSLVPGDGALYLQGFLLGGYYDIDRTRTIAIPDMVVVRNASSDNDAWSVSAGGEVGLNFEVSSRTWLQPFAGISWGQYWGDGYTETGAQSLNLTVQGQSANEWQPTAGARLLFGSRDGRDVLTPFVGAAFLAQLPVGDWAPVYTSEFNLNQPTQVSGDPEDRYGGTLQAGIEFARFDGMTAYIAFDGAWLTGKQRYGGQIGVFVPF